MSWWRGVPSARVPVQCCGTTHTIVWRRGALALPDHDVEAERTMTALGADTPACLEILDAWRDGFRDADYFPVLQFWSGSSPMLLSSFGHIPRSNMPANARLWLLASVLDIPEPLLDRQAWATIARYCRRTTWADSQQRAGEYIIRPDLKHVLAGKAAPLVAESLRSWRRTLGQLPDVDVDVGEPRIDGHAEPDGGRISLTLPVEWLLDVHARGLAVVDGCFVLSAGGEGELLDALAVRWEREGSKRSVPVTGRARLTRTNGAWRAQWR